MAKACRWVSLPGETSKAAVSTSTKSRAANQARKAAVIRPRAAGKAGGLHARRGAKTACFVAHLPQRNRAKIEHEKDWRRAHKIAMVRPETAVPRRPKLKDCYREGHR